MYAVTDKKMQHF